MDAKLKDVRTYFNMLSEDGGTTISVDQVIKAVRMAGQNPSNKELALVLNQFKLETDARVTYEELVQIISKCWSNENYEEELSKAFKVFDKSNRGRLSKKKLRSVMMRKGEKLDEEEFEEFMRLAENHTETHIDINSLIKNVLKPFDNLETNANHHQATSETHKLNISINEASQSTQVANKSVLEESKHEIPPQETNNSMHSLQEANKSVLETSKYEGNNGAHKNTHPPLNEANNSVIESNKHNISVQEENKSINMVNQSLEVENKSILETSKHELHGDIKSVHEHDPIHETNKSILETSKHELPVHETNRSTQEANKSILETSKHEVQTKEENSSVHEAAQQLMQDTNSTVVETRKHEPPVNVSENNSIHETNQSLQLVNQAIFETSKHDLSLVKAKNSMHDANQSMHEVSKINESVQETNKHENETGLNKSVHEAS